MKVRVTTINCPGSQQIAWVGSEWAINWGQNDKNYKEAPPLQLFNERPRFLGADPAGLPCTQSEGPEPSLETSSGPRLRGRDHGSV